MYPVPRRTGPSGSFIRSLRRVKNDGAQKIRLLTVIFPQTDARTSKVKTLITAPEGELSEFLNASSIRVVSSVTTGQSGRRLRGDASAKIAFERLLSDTAISAGMQSSKNAGFEQQGDQSLLK